MRAETEGGKPRGPVQKSADPQIVARDLVKTYRLGGSVIGALQGVSVEVARGEYLAVTGASGSGKSTFMNLIGALDTPTSGSLQIEGREMGGLSSDQLALYRNERGVMGLVAKSQDNTAATEPFPAKHDDSLNASHLANAARRLLRPEQHRRQGDRPTPGSARAQPGRLPTLPGTARARHDAPGQVCRPDHSRVHRPRGRRSRTSWASEPSGALQRR